MEDKPKNTDLNSLENSDSNSLSNDSQSANKSEVKVIQNKKINTRIRDLITHVNIYLLSFVFIILLTGGLVFVGYQNSKKEVTTPTIDTQELTQEAIDKLKGAEAKVGDPKQLLSIESNTIFSGKVLVRDSLDVAGSLKVGGTLSLPGITVSGVSSFDQIQGNNLAISGDATVQGGLNVQKNLTVAGTGTFGSEITAPSLRVTTLRVEGDIIIPFHIDAGGSLPSKSDGNALGSGGTTSLSGTDTAGTLTVNIGGGPTSGCFATITFAKPFSGVPHIAISPVGSAAGGLNLYVTRTTTQLSICSSNVATASTSFAVDYIAID